MCLEDVFMANFSNSVTNLVVGETGVGYLILEKILNFWVCGVEGPGGDIAIDIDVNLKIRIRQILSS